MTKTPVMPKSVNRNTLQVSSNKSSWLDEIDDVVNEEPSKQKSKVMSKSMRLVKFIFGSFMIVLILSGIGSFIGKNDNQISSATTSNVTNSTLAIVPADVVEYDAILTCGRGGDENINIVACFKSKYSDTELELQNGDFYNLYKFYSIQQAGRENEYGLRIHLNNHFSIKAQNSSDIFVLGLKIVDRKTNNIVYQKQVGRFGVIYTGN